MPVTFEGSAADLNALSDLLTHCAGKQVQIGTEGHLSRADGLPRDEGRPMVEVLDNLITATENLVVHVGRGQARVTIDSFGRRTINLDDVEHFPSTPPDRQPSATTRCEVLIHILAEYKHAMHAGHLLGGTGFDEAHAAGLAAQERQRRATGQLGPVHGSQLIPGTNDGETRYCNGSRTVTHLGADGHVTGVDHEEPPPQACDGVRRLVNEGWTDGEGVAEVDTLAIDRAKKAAKAAAGREAKRMERSHLCPRLTCQPHYEPVVDDPTGRPILDSRQVDEVTTQYRATIAAHWALYLTCSGG